MKIAAIVLLLTFGFASSAMADETKDAFVRGLAAQRSGDNATALEEYQFAAERRDAGAQAKLGVMYMYGGRSISQDYVQAHMWLNLSLANAPPGAERTASITNSMLVAGFMNPAQITEAQKLALEWAQTHPVKLK